ncbi:MAG: hydroxymethylpyrimidine/phosphomethylpyrimidine kinase [Mesorhizobium sp.]|nr:MAG: hydroxymethylpyrimidine/phosphomethylpyrimidine kinase [Mesorhizobium sp.]
MHAALQAKVAAIKIGMLATEQIIAAVAAVLRENRHIPAVLDPVLASSSGGPLLEASAIGSLTRNLMPLCRLVTPNLIELAVLAGSDLAKDDDGALQQGQKLLTAGLQALLIKGGHAAGCRSTDILLRADQEPIRFDAPRLAGSMRGTGCALASAIAAHLANGSPLEDGVRKSKLLVFEKIRKSISRD